MSQAPTTSDTTRQSSAAVAGASPARPRRSRWVAYALLTALAAVPVVVSAARWLGRDLHLNGDGAILDLRVADVISTHPPLVGLYSRFGWSHPGPVAFYLLAPFRLLSGDAPWGIVFGTVVWSTASLVLITVLAARRGGYGLVAFCLAMQIAVWYSVGGTATADPWTPELAVSLVIPTLLAVWGTAEGDGLALVVAVVTASIAIQTHVGLALVLLVPLALGVGLAAWHRQLERRPLVTAVVVGGVLWLPVALDAIANGGGNARKLADFFTSSAVRSAGFETGARMFASEVHPWPAWLVGRGHAQTALNTAAQANVVWLVLLGLGLAVALAIAWRRADRQATDLVLIAGATSAAGVVAIGQVRGLVAPYLIFFRSAVALFACFAIGYTVYRLLVGQWTVVARVATVASIVVLAFVTVRLIPPVIDTTLPYLDQPKYTELGTQALHHAPREGQVLLRYADYSYSGVMPGVLVRLNSGGVDARVDRGLGFIFGSSRTGSAEEANQVWYISESPTSAALLLGQPGAKVVATTSNLSATKLEALYRLQREIASELRRRGHGDLIPTLSSPLVTFAVAKVPGLDQSRVRQLAAMNARLRLPFATVIAFPAHRLPHIWWPGQPV